MLIAQISDPHLRPRGILYQGVVDSNAMFAEAIRCLNGLAVRPDLVIVSGDVVDNGTPAEYEVAREILATLQIPWVGIPGNHDERDAFRSSFANHIWLPESGPLHFAIGDRGPVRIIGLDVTVPGQHHGLFDDAATNWLERTLAKEPSRPTLIMMHQPPIATHVPYLDAYWCKGGDRLMQVIGSFPSVERVACGHVHRFMLTRFAGTTLCTAPSTTTAIALQLSHDAKPASYIEPPGLLLHHWMPETGLVTHLIPIGTFPGPYPFA
jgi:3',5'-cyclic AMP phosphodiesterase CpdA